MKTKTKDGLKKFVEQMDLKLYIREEKYGDSWTNVNIDFLEKKLLEEMNEYLAENKHGKKSCELVDIANVCMMLYNRHFNIWIKEGAKKNVLKIN